MSGEFNDLKSIIMKENECAFFVHCFSHQLQLSLLVVAKKHDLIGTFFTVVSNVVNVVGALFKRHDILWEKQALKVIEVLKGGELLSGRGQNQESGIKRPCDTRWGSHFGKLYYHNILGITNELSQVLQKGDQDIVNAMDLVKICKKQLQMTRDNGWDSLVEEVYNFRMKFNIDVLDMNHMYCPQGKSQCKAPRLTNFHYFRVDFFNTVIDLQLQELNSHFNEANTELLLCLACLSPANSFSSFDKGKLIRLVQLYPCDFSTMDIKVLEYQLQTHVDDMRSHVKFSGLKGMVDLSKKLVETKKVYPLVYLLIKLALTLPVATTLVERAFSTMNIVKNQIHNKIGDQWLNDSLTVYLEKDVFNAIDN
ncbi:uncharacterized protein LOC133779036 [Humulus lupulus]|uniref:uncharacterized protein LOC133779036 n=1 Tax=Humulus lupulus TaxID=3486 RepID=UPI002B41673C|nr:uncharacterized protein LOC133779036 [Humulus lupulus]